MTSVRNLEGPIIDAGNTTKCLVCFLHGYGSNGNDLIQIGEIWKNELPDITFLSPDGPEPCSQNPSGKQWFDIYNYDKKQIFFDLQRSFLDLEFFLNENLQKYNLASDKFFLVGFSQGTMLSLHTALRMKVLGVIGYSGAFLGDIPENKMPSNDYLLLHGKNDEVVPVEKLFEAKEKLRTVSKTLKSKVFNNLEHSINEEGLQAGLNFIKNKLRLV